MPRGGSTAHCTAMRHFLLKLGARIPLKEFRRLQETSQQDNDVVWLHACMFSVAVGRQTGRYMQTPIAHRTLACHDCLKLGSNDNGLCMNRHIGTPTFSR